MPKDMSMLTFFLEKSVLTVSYQHSLSPLDRRLISPQTETYIWMIYPLFSNLNLRPISGISSWNPGGPSDCLDQYDRMTWFQSQAQQLMVWELLPLLVESQLACEGVTAPGKPSLRSLSPRNRLWSCGCLRRGRGSKEEPDLWTKKPNVLEIDRSGKPVALAKSRYL